MNTKFDDIMKKTDDIHFLRLYGYTKTAMKVTAGILRKAYAAKHKRRGRHAKLDAADMLQGIKKYHGNSETPKKKSKKCRLGKEDKASNRRIGLERIVIEHVNASLKRFHIFAERYRNRRRRFGLRISLICGLYNFELAR